MQLKHLSAFLATLSLTAADILVASTTQTGANLAIAFGAGPNQPDLSAITQIDVSLIGGGVTAADQVLLADSGTIPYAGTYTLPLTLAKIPQTSTSNAFYLKITSTTSSGTLINYSNRFTLSGGTGTWTNAAAEQAVAAAPAVGAVPSPQLPAGAAAAASSTAGAAAGGPGNSNWGDPHPTGDWPPYSEQDSLVVKTAPMQGRPGPSITQTNTAPLYGTSMWSVFATFAPIPIQTHTNTPSPTMSASSRENTASPAPKPSDDMAKFLARWQD